MDQYVTGGAIRRLREERGLTQAKLAERLDVSAKAVSKWETGARASRTSPCWSPWPGPWGRR